MSLPIHLRGFTGSFWLALEDHALRLRTHSATNVTVRDGQVIIGSIHNKA